MHYLYWIHFKEHTDPFSEGYIGVSSQPATRFRQHTSDRATRAGSKVVRRIAEEYGVETLKHTILDSFSSRDEARIVERQYRPETIIGWNIWTGGGVNPDCTGREMSDETKKQIGKSNKSTKATRSYVSPFKGMTERHGPETKALIGSYHKGKTITEKHRKSASEKMLRDKSPKAKSITLQNMETGSIHEYGCIRSASEDLEINYSALRSAIRGNQDSIYRKWKILPQGSV